MRPPQRFIGQIELPNSDASWWNGSSITVSRTPLVLNRWRVYDPRVGEYLQPEPMLMRGELTTMHPYAYAMSAPADYGDPSGENPIAIGGALWWCIVSGWCEAAAIAGIGAIGTGILWLQSDAEMRRQERLRRQREGYDQPECTDPPLPPIDPPGPPDDDPPRSPGEECREELIECEASRLGSEDGNVLGNHRCHACFLVCLEQVPGPAVSAPRGLAVVT